MSVLEIKNLTKKYKDTTALDNVSVSLDEGKIYGLIGPNGAGKTTLFKTIMTYVHPTSGQVLLDGETVFENQNALDKLAIMRAFQVQAGSFVVDSPYFGLKVKKCLEMGEAFFKNWDKALAERLIGVFNIPRNKSFTKMSSGAQSGLGIVMSLAANAPITLLDEPTAGLDAVARDNFYNILIEEMERNPRTFVISTHLIDEAAPVFEEILFINGGKLFFKENADVVRESYMYVTGSQDVIDSVPELKNIKGEKVGTKTVIIVETKSLPRDLPSELTVSAVPMQKLFVHLMKTSGGVHNDSK